MVGIYIIKNKINGKIYIGQSRNIAKRWNTHLNTATNLNKKEYDYPLYRAMRKYGKENFSFEVLEECSIDQLNEKEEYWINYYNTLGINGYNQTGIAFNQHGQKLTLDQVEEITNKLLYNPEISNKEIAQQYGVSIHAIKDINVGRTWYREGLKYPLKEIKETRSLKNYCPYCGKEISFGSISCKDCHYKKLQKTERPDKETLYSLLKQNSFLSVGRMFGVSDNTIRKWCKSYGIPFHSKDYK